MKTAAPETDGNAESVQTVLMAIPEKQNINQQTCTSNKCLISKFYS